ncbi:MAG: hypothetical protein IT438_09400 [Phycisphaerales bacterium]|nr:hypothetical protein [Phycisphaerales bacterium]
MRLVFLHNPSSGRGNRGRAADRNLAAIAAARAAGFAVDDVESGPARRPADLRDHLRDADALVIAGGDGSVHHAAPAAIDTGIPIYHFPRGTENLFAREFGMTRSIEDLLEALRRFRTRTIDTAVANGRVFVIMAGIGFDSAVVARVAGSRRGGVSRADYLRHGLGVIRDWAVPRLTISIDGRETVHAQSGQLVVANFRSYAAHLNPASAARPDDHTLDIIFAPYATRIGLARRLAAIGSQTHFDHADILTTSGRAVRIELPDGPVPLQLDGESVHIEPPLLELSIRPETLNVLLPA